MRPIARWFLNLLPLSKRAERLSVDEQLEILYKYAHYLEQVEGHKINVRYEVINGLVDMYIEDLDEPAATGTK